MSLRQAARLPCTDQRDNHIDGRRSCSRHCSACKEGGLQHRCAADDERADEVQRTVGYPSCIRHAGRQRIAAPAVAGEFTLPMPFAALLEGSGLRYEFMNDDRIVTIRTGLKARGAADVSQAGRCILRTPIHLLLQTQKAQVRAGQAQLGIVWLIQANPQPRKAFRDSGQGIAGLNMDIRRTQDDTQPYVIFERQAIRQSGAPLMSPTSSRTG